MPLKGKNCWEYMKCGRAQGGTNAGELGVCPATADESFDGINLGKNAGRICWAVAGTFCDGRVQGTFAEKRDSCIDCGFYKLVHEEEGTANSDAKFLRFVSEDSASHILKNLSYKHVRAGDRFITQGEVLDSAYIIQRGSCLVVVEKEAELHPVRHLGEGDIVGELSILTGEPQNAHVEAETEMDLWVLKKRQFDDLTGRGPEVLEFLTDIVADRFDSKRPMADRTIGKYLATDVIGSGGYSIVYRGVHKSLNMPVAIKMMRHNLAMDSCFQSSFWNEAKTVAAFNHENIIKVYDIEELYRTIFIIMEVMEGESLKGMIQRLKTIPPIVASHFLAQICSGLSYAHQRRVLHLDVNPSNIFVEAEDRIKIIDFGMACPSGSDDRSIFDGTVLYMAPEQIECEPVDERADIYSLGITAYEMVTGRRPFPEEDIKTVMNMHVNQEIPDPITLAPDLPEALRCFIIKACHRDPVHRYADAGQALKDLLPLAGDYGLNFKDYGSLGPIEVLINEHGLIRQFLDNLAIAVDKLETDEGPPREFFEKAVQFARDFTDKFHHFKEEHVMFVRLAEKKSGVLDGQVDSLRHQHERGRNFIAEISNSLEGYAKGDDIQTTALLENLAAYIHLLRHHIHKEDHMFFGMVKREFSESELQGIMDLFDKENQKGNVKSSEDGRRLVQEMAELL